MSRASPSPPDPSMTNVGTPESDWRDLQKRLALNETIERDLNAFIVADLDEDERNQQFHSFWCECSQPICGERLQINRFEWARVRANSHRFFVAPGHVDDRIERLVERTERFWVVDKSDEVPAEIAERTDPIRNPAVGRHERALS